jgi:hypothetical protein
LGAGSQKTGFNTFCNPGALELGDRPEDVHLQLTGGRRRVDALTERGERNSERVQLLEERDQVAEVASEAIESPHRHDIA